MGTHQVNQVAKSGVVFCQLGLQVSRVAQKKRWVLRNSLAISFHLPKYSLAISLHLKDHFFSFEVKFLVEQVSQKCKALSLLQKLNSSRLETHHCYSHRYTVLHFWLSELYAVKGMVDVLQDFKTVL